MSLHSSISRSLNRKDVLALLALLALVLVFFWKLAFTNLIIARGDIFYYFYPYRDFAAQAVREGRVALWNPYLFMGAPFMANSQSGFFYPFNLLMSWLDTTRAINWTIVLHIFIAAGGSYVFARSILQLSIAASLLAAISFGLGGYLGTQIEHINQLQGLAWIGWIFLAYGFAVRSNSEVRIWNWRWIPLALLIAVQLLAGHTQSVFITLVGLAFYALWLTCEAVYIARRSRTSLATHYSFLVTHYWLPLLLVVLIALGLSAIQLLPTLELTRNSARSGGLPTNLAVSFSLDPRLLGRALLPDYDGALPAGGEFTAFFSIAALMLMTIGVATWRRAAAQTRAVAIVAFIGLFFALGGYNPLYYLLLKIPGFDLFRAPARWIVLFAFAGSLLAGIGLDALRQRTVSWKSVLLAAVLTLLLAGLVWSSVGLTPAGASGPLERPSTQSLLLWTGALLAAVALVFFARRTSHDVLIAFCLVLLAACELFLATRQLTYNSRATAPDALLSLRPPITYLLQAGQGSTPPDRFLSISDIFFDPGDKTELQSIFNDQLPEAAFYDLIVATKMKEIIAPNLPLVYRVPAVDGYDGGVLPLKDYIEFQKLFLDPALIQSDGRLREQLQSIPAARWLDLMNARYVITDKVGDQWYDGVLHDLRFVTPLAAGETVSTTRVPALRADALSVVYSDARSPDTLARIEVTFEDGSTQRLEMRDQPSETKEGRSAVRLTWDEPRRVTALKVTGAGGLTLHGLALVNSQNGAFQSFVIAPQGQFELVHSGDVKIYENGTVLPRAFLVDEVQPAAGDTEAMQLMQAETFDPAKTVVIDDSGNLEQSDGKDNLSVSPSPLPSIISYSPEQVVIDANASQPGYLVVTDAYYPGWIATVDGQPAGIERADLMFRAVKVPAGQHRVEFHYQPQSLSVGAWISIATVVVLVGAWLVLRRRNRLPVL